MKIAFFHLCAKLIDVRQKKNQLIRNVSKRSLIYSLFACNWKQMIITHSYLRCSWVLWKRYCFSMVLPLIRRGEKTRFSPKSHFSSKKDQKSKKAFLILKSFQSLLFVLFRSINHFNFNRNKVSCHNSVTRIPWTHHPFWRNWP